MLKANKTFLESMVAGYLEAAAWSTSECDEEGNDLDNLEGYDFSEEAVRQAENDCRNFLELADEEIDASELDADQVGHDFWLTREGHGAGFWDRGLGEVGEALTEHAKSFGSGDLYKGDDDLLYFG
jgi:hypothetical protein